MTSDHTPDGGAMDTRRIVVVTRFMRDLHESGTPKGKQLARAQVVKAYDAAPSLADLWLLIVNAINEKPRWQPSDVADAVLAVLLGTDPEEAPRGE